MLIAPSLVRTFVRASRRTCREGAGTHAQGLSSYAISRKTGIARSTLLHWLDAPGHALAKARSREVCAFSAPATYAYLLGLYSVTGGSAATPAPGSWSSRWIVVTRRSSERLAGPSERSPRAGSPGRAVDAIQEQSMSAPMADTGPPCSLSMGRAGSIFGRSLSRIGSATSRIGIQRVCSAASSSLMAAA